MPRFSPSSRRLQPGVNRYSGALIAVLALLGSACVQGPIGDSSTPIRHIGPVAHSDPESTDTGTRRSATYKSAAKSAQLSAKTDVLGAIGDKAAVPSVFGSVQVRRSDIRAFVRVRSALALTYRELDDAAVCRSNHWTKCPVAEWKAFLGKLDGRDRKSQLRAVNRYVNRARYVSDQRNYGMADFWATAGQLLRRGGDCEDYVVAKYVSLRALGVPVDRMRMAVVFDRVRRVGHAVLLIDIGAETLVLDNQSQYVLPAQRVTRYQAVYSINEHNWWIHQTSQRAAAMPPVSANIGDQG